MNMTRRALLRTTAIVPLAVIAAGCSTIQTQLPQFVTDMNTIAAALQSVLPQIQTLTGLPAATLATIQSAITTAQNAAAQVASTIAAGTTTGINGLISGFGSAVSTVAGLIGGNAPGFIGTLLTAVQTLLPAILSVAGIALAPPAMAGPGMTPEMARGILRSAIR
jgi:ABC-type transporter Mla subunit MlaD